MHPLIVGHTQHSKTVHPRGMGEITNTEKFIRLTGGAQTLDIYQLFGGGKEAHHKLANYAQQQMHRALLGENVPPLKPERSYPTAPLTFLWTFDHLTFCLLQTPLPHSPLITRLIITQPEDLIPTHLHERSTLVMCTSPLARQLWIQQGLPSWKAFLLPHHYPHEALTAQPQRAPYIERLEKLNHKPLPKDSLLIGTTSRFLAFKNIEATLHIAHKICQRYPHTRFILKGSYDSSWDTHEAKGQTQRLRQLIAKFHKEPWFFWDYKPTPYPEILQHYANLDLALNLTGAELASTVTIEQLAVKTPVLMLDGTTNNSLFNGAVAFAPNQGITKMRRALTHYHLPHMQKTTSILSRLIENDKAREQLATKGHQITLERFSPELALQRARLMMRAAQGLHGGEKGWEQQLTDYGQQDQDRFTRTNTR